MFAPRLAYTPLCLIINRRSCPKPLDAIKKNLARQTQKQVISEEAARLAAENIRPEQTLGDWLNAADFIIEAVSEVQPVKQRLYKEADVFVSDGAVFASNTSSYSISELAKHIRHPENFIGMHFMNRAIDGVSGNYQRRSNFGGYGAKNGGAGKNAEQTNGKVQRFSRLYHQPCFVGRC